MWNILGHHRAVSLLQQAVRSGTPNHAYLFLGPPRTGKSTIARTFAQALNCTGQEPPCGHCPDCQKILHGSHPDVDIVVAGDTANPKAKLIKIERFRDVIRQSTLLPAEGRYKVVIIDADAVLSVQASALLKTLEEPGGHIVFVLTALTEDRIPHTIVSRCQVLHLAPMPREALARALTERFALTLDRATRIAWLAGGRAGRAIDLIENPSILETEEADIDRLLAAWNSRSYDRLVLSASLSTTAERANEALEVWASWWRDAMSVAVGHETGVARLERLADLRTFVARSNPAALAHHLHCIQRTADLLASNVNPRLAMEVLSLELSPTSPP